MFTPICGCWELKLGRLEEQPVLLTTEPSLQPPGLYSQPLLLILSYSGQGKYSQQKFFYKCQTGMLWFLLFYFVFSIYWGYSTERGPSSVYQNVITGVGETAQQLRTKVFLPENLSLIPSTPMAAHNYL